MICDQCGKESKRFVRGVCNGCYETARMSGGLGELPNLKARLTEADVIRIRSKPRSMEDRQRLAEELGVTPSTIWKVVTRSTWTHV